MIRVTDIIKAVELHATELSAGVYGSLKFPHEHLADATGLPLSECLEACKHAADVGILEPGQITPERFRLSDVGRSMRDELVAKSGLDQR